MSVTLTHEQSENKRKGGNKPHPGDILKMDPADQKKVSEKLFNSKSMHNFRDDLRTESLVRRKWSKLLSILSDSGVVLLILDNYMTLTEREILNQRRTHSTGIQVCALNMYISLYRSLTSTLKKKSLLIKKLIEQDGPTLLWIILK